MNFITPINHPEPTVKIWSRDEFNNVLDEFYDLFEIAFRESINRYIDEGKLLALDSEALEYRTEKSEIAEFFFDSYFKAGKIFAYSIEQKLQYVQFIQSQKKKTNKNTNKTREKRITRALYSLQ